MRISAMSLLAIAAIVTLARPDSALAQTSSTGVEPIFISGDASPDQIMKACGIARERAFLDPSPIVSKPSKTVGGFTFSVTIEVSGELLKFDDTSPTSQLNGTPGVEAVAVKGEGTNVYCYPTRYSDSELGAPPGSGSPSGIIVVWGPGPCLLDDTQLGKLCLAYNESDRITDFVHAQKIHPESGELEVNVCGCPPVVVQNCDPARPPGTADSCNPDNEPLAGAPLSHTLVHGGTTSHVLYCPSRGTYVLAGTAGTSGCLPTRIGHH
jgi:hypothetical protein